MPTATLGGGPASVEVSATVAIVILAWLQQKLWKAAVPGRL